MSIDVSYFFEYQEGGKSLIPVRGKISLVKNWQDFSKRLPSDDEIDSWELLNNVTGVAVVMGAATNICCVDIDEEDPLMLQKLLDACPHSPVVKKGKKGETRFFRLFDDPKTFDPSMFGNKRAINNKRGKRAVDILLSGSYSVIPPSIHPDTNQPYVLTGEKLTSDYDIEKMPILDINHTIATLNSTVAEEQVTEQQVADAKPSGRYNAMLTECAKLISQKFPGDYVVQSLLLFDSENNSDRLYFTDKSKGHKTLCPITNAYKYYGDVLSTLASKKPTLGEIETPNLSLSQDKKVKEKNVEGWGPMMALEIEKRKLEFDDSLIPEPWADWVISTARRTGKAPYVLYYPALAALSSLIGNKVRIQPKTNDRDWTEAANIWTLLVARSGSRKTQVLKLATRAITELQKKISEEHKANLATYKQDEKQQKLIIKSLDMQLQKSVDAGEPQPYLDKIKDQLKDEEAKLKPINMKQLKVNIATPEALIDIFQVNETGTLIVENELHGLMRRMDKKGYETLRSLLMDSWDGTESFTYNTKTHGLIEVENLCGSLIANTQPSKLNELMVNIYNGKDDDGFLQRSLIIADEDNATEMENEVTSEESVYRATNIFHLAYNMPRQEKNTYFTAAAERAIKTYVKLLKDKSNTETNDAMASFISKFSGMCAKIAYLVEFISLDGKSVPPVVNESSVMTAIKMLQYNESFIRYTFEQSVSRRDNDLLIGVVDMIKSGIIKDGQSMREIYRENQKVFKNAKDVLMVMKNLEELNYCKIEAGIARSYTLRINPLL